MSIDPEVPNVAESSSKSVEDPTNSTNKPSSSDMLFFYERLLPFRQIFQWLNHSPKPQKDFTMREFAFEYRTGAYQRYNSFTGPEDFKKSVIKANPTRFEVGAVYSVNPKERKNLPKNALKPVSKELVFDLDLTDYDEVRTCCSGTAICKKCWKFIQVASKVVDAALREDFGFKQFIWVFSGRRGAHCWVSDKRARELDESSRRAIIEYLDVSKNNKKIMRKPLHPHLERSFNILKEEFANIILDEQDAFATNYQDLLNFIPDKTLKEELENHWKTSVSSSREKWEEINVFAKRILKNQRDASLLADAKKDIIIHYLYPRLDLEVSKQVIHLLKSPFCIHPGTGNVCVPFDPIKDIVSDDSYGFDPTTAPNLRRLQNELVSWETENAARDQSMPENQSGNEPKRISDWEKTSLKPYVEYFTNHVQQIIQEEAKKRERNNDMDF